MNKNEKIASFETVDRYGVTQITNEVLLSDKMPIGYSKISTWVENRNYAKHKEHMKKWLKEWGIDSVDGFLQITHGLGLNDSFWVKSLDSELIWEKVNLYENEFTDIACTTAFETGLFGLQLSTTTPEFTTDGSFPKCWIKDDSGIHILKQGLRGACNVGLEPYCEFVSSNIGKLIFPEVVGYDLVMYKGKLCSKCSLFTSEQVGYVPFGRVVSNDMYYTIPDVIDFFQEYDSRHHTKFEQKFRRMILLDSIVFNTDRHLSNFGFLFDNESLEIVDFAPLFDFNLSFLCSLTIGDLKDYRESFVKYDLNHKLGGDFTEVGRQIATPELLEVLPPKIELPLHEKYNMNVDRMNLLEDIFHENYEIIRNGYKKSFQAVKYVNSF